jgi:hypothetical protein
MLTMSWKVRMIRLPYEQIQLQAERLLYQVLSPTSEMDVFEAYQRYVDFLEATGWTDKEFDEETARRTDDSWHLDKEQN